MLNKNNFYVSVLIWAAVLGALYLTDLYSYLLFHTLAEMFSVAVAVAIFILVWNVRRSLDNPYLLFVGVAYLFIGCLDLVHNLAHHGMGLFNRNEANLQTQLWIANRYLESLSLLIGSFFFGRRLKLEFVLVGYVAATSLILGTIFYWNVFPACFVEGMGLTPFKQLSDYIIVLILAASIAMLAKKRARFDPAGLRFIVASIAFNILSELCFSFFTDVYGFPYFLGHFLKLISLYCIYKAIVELGLSKPFEVLFRNLKESEDALRRERDFISAILSTAGALLVILDPQGRIVRFNRACERLTGYSFEEVEGRPFWDLFLIPEEVGPVKAVFAQPTSEQFPSEHENHWTAKDGRRHPILWSNRFLFGSDGSVEYVVGAGLDITERKRAEEALKKAHEELERRVQERTSELVAANQQLAQEIEERRRVEAALDLERNKFKSILEAMADGVYIANQHHDIEYANPAIEKEFGPSEGRKCYEYFHDGTESCPSCKNKEVFTGKSTQWEWYSPKTGKTYEVFDAPVPNADGSISRLEILHDVTQLKNAEKALRESEVKHRIVADNTYNWEWWRDQEGNFIYNSPSCKRVTQHEIEEFAADPDLLFKIIHPDDRSAFNRHVEEVEQNDVAGETEFRILRPDGSLRWLAHACQPVFDENGRLMGRRGSNRDITAHKSADDALRESEKQLQYLSSRLLTAQETERSRIARELHDELGGALAVLKLRTRFVEKNLQPDQTAIRAECRQNLQYIDQIIDDVHRLSRDLSPSILEDIGLTPALKWLVDNFAGHYGLKSAADIEDIDHLVPRDDQIMIYRTLQEALTNIGKHAQAENVMVQVRNGTGRISFRIEDDGSGFDVEELTAKTVIEKGLGLAAMNERARMLGGKLHLWSEPGKGTRIDLSIPITQGERL